MGNKVKMSEFDLWELRVKCVIWVFNESSKNFQSYWFSDKKGFLPNIYFSSKKKGIMPNELGLVKNCQNMNRLSAIKIELEVGKIKLGSPLYYLTSGFIKSTSGRIHIGFRSV